MKPLLLGAAGLIFVLAACFVSRFATPDWTGGIVGALSVGGVFASFAAGRLSRD